MHKLNREVPYLNDKCLYTKKSHAINRKHLMEHFTTIFINWQHVHNIMIFMKQEYSSTQYLSSKCIITLFWLHVLPLYYTVFLFSAQTVTDSVLLAEQEIAENALNIETLNISLDFRSMLPHLISKLLSWQVLKLPYDVIF